MVIKVTDIAGPYKSEVYLAGEYPVVIAPAQCEVANRLKTLNAWNIREIMTSQVESASTPGRACAKLAQEIARSAISGSGAAKKVAMKDTQSVDLGEFL